MPFFCNSLACFDLIGRTLDAAFDIAPPKTALVPAPVALCCNPSAVVTSPSEAPAP